jgi:hypothetical protein
MTQELYQQDRRLIEQRIHALSSREQIEILLTTTQSLRSRDRAAILGATGFHFLRHRGIDFVLRFIISRFLKGFLLSVTFVIIGIVCILLLALFETNRPALIAIISTLAAYFIGFLAFSIGEFIGDIRPFLRRNAAQEEREKLIEDIGALTYADKIAVLQMTGSLIFRRGLGNSLIGSYLTGIALSIVGAIISATILFVSIMVTTYAGAQIASFVPPVAAVAAFLGGFLVPRFVQQRLNRLTLRSRNAPLERDSRQPPLR